MRAWRDIVGLEGRYQVSNDGYVRSLPDIDTRRRFVTGRILKAAKNQKGYLHVVLADTDFRVHRLVATAFLDNPDALPEVNHKNGIKTDNRVANLEWCDGSHNQRHRYEVLGHVGAMQGKRGIKCANSQPVCGIPVAGGEQLYFGSMAEAQRITGIHATGIGMVVRGELRTYMGYIWSAVSREEFCEAANV